MRQAFWFVTCLFVLCSAESLFGDDFVSSITKFDQNQSKIRTLVATGTVKVEIYAGTQTTATQTISSALSLFLKSPDTVKISFSGQAPFAMVQKGEFISQRAPGSNAVVTTKATTTTDLFNKYLNIGVSKNAAGFQITASEQVVDHGIVLQKYSAKIPELPAGTSGAASKAMFTKAEFYFDPNSMLVRTVFLDNDRVVFQTDYTYSKVGEVFVANLVRSTVVSAQAKIVNTMSYTGISVNTNILDSEFDLSSK